MKFLVFIILSFASAGIAQAQDSTGWRVDPSAVSPMTKDQILSLPCVKAKTCPLLGVFTFEMFIHQVWKAEPKSLVLMGAGISPFEGSEQNLSIACVGEGKACNQFQFVYYVNPNEVYLLASRFEIQESKKSLADLLAKLTGRVRKIRGAKLGKTMEMRDGWGWSSRPGIVGEENFNSALHLLTGLAGRNGTYEQNAYNPAIIFWHLPELKELPMADQAIYENYMQYNEYFEKFGIQSMPGYAANYEEVYCDSNEKILAQGARAKLKITPTENAGELLLTEKDRTGKLHRTLIERYLTGPKEQAIVVNSSGYLIQFRKLFLKSAANADLLDALDRSGAPKELTHYLQDVRVERNGNRLTVKSGLRGYTGPMPMDFIQKYYDQTVCYQKMKPESL